MMKKQQIIHIKKMSILLISYKISIKSGLFQKGGTTNFVFPGQIYDNKTTNYLYKKM